MQTITINFIVSGSWEEMPDKRLRYVYKLLADNFSTHEAKIVFLLKWCDTKVIAVGTPALTLSISANMFELKAITLAEQKHGAFHNSAEAQLLYTFLFLRLGRLCEPPVPGVNHNLVSRSKSLFSVLQTLIRLASAIRAGRR